MEIIAEIGQNHNGDMNLALELIHAAKENGADVAKFQLYDAVSLFPKDNNEWYEYNCKTELSRDQIELLSSECEKVGIEFMSSVFDIERIKWLEDLNVKRYKVASRSIHDDQLIKELCKTKKPLIISLGMWKEDVFPQIQSEADVAFLHCIAQYPASLEDISFGTVSFDKYAGFSDHTLGISAAVVAFSRGAKIVEKHFTLDKKMYGPDHCCSMSPDELKALSTFRDDIKACV